MKRITIKIDPDLCIGAASCVTITPGVFSLNDENKAVVSDPEKSQEPAVYERTIEVSDELFDSIKFSAESCPTRAIFLYDEEGNQLYP